MYFHFSRGLPSVEALRDYRPPQVTKVLCADGSVCAEYFLERRTLVDASALPARTCATPSWRRRTRTSTGTRGWTTWGMLRAGLKALRPGGHLTGASTITQQACRNLLLTQERKVSRKIREWILTPRMERALTKDQILNLYLNQINFGHSRYGIEEAALFYFGKHASQLDVSEAAVLAGTVQQPARINPLTSLTKAKARQAYVLQQMVKHGFLSETGRARRSGAAAGAGAPAAAGPRAVLRGGNPPLAGGPLRRGTGAGRGLRVEIAMDPRLQAFADEALRDGLETLDRRMGYRGPLGTLDAKRYTALRHLLEERLAEAGRREKENSLVADVGPLVSAAARSEEAEAAEVDTEGEAEAAPEEALAQAVPLLPVHEGLTLGGYVTRVDDASRTASVDFVGRTGTPLLLHRGLGPSPRGGQVDAAPAEAVGRAGRGPGGAGARAGCAGGAQAAGGDAGPGAGGAGGPDGHRPGHPPGGGAVRRL